MRKPVVDYRHFRLSRLNEPQFSHLKLLAGWIVYFAAYVLTENLIPAERCIPVHCWLDDIIPFCEWFLIPYLFWFVFMVGMIVYSLLWDVDAFRRFMKFIMFTYTVTLIIYLVYPSMQNLRPAEFERDNVLTRFMASYYVFDTNTNVCPSMHVIGSVAVLCAAWNSKAFSTTPWRIAFTVVTLLISFSTVFLKQHSFVDVPPAFLLSAAGWWVAHHDFRRSAAKSPVKKSPKKTREKAV